MEKKKFLPSVVHMTGYIYLSLFLKWSFNVTAYVVSYDHYKYGRNFVLTTRDVFRKLSSICDGAFLWKYSTFKSR